MATENNLNNHNVHQEEKEDNLHDLDQGNLLRGFDNCSSALYKVKENLITNFLYFNLNKKQFLQTMLAVILN